MCLRVVDTHKPGQWQEDPGALHRNAVGGWDPGMRVTLHHGSDTGLRPLKKQLESRRVRVCPQQNRPVVGLVVRGEVWCSLQQFNVSTKCLLTRENLSGSPLSRRLYANRALGSNLCRLTLTFAHSWVQTQSALSSWQLANINALRCGDSRVLNMALFADSSNFYQQKARESWQNYIPQSSKRRSCNHGVIAVRCKKSSCGHCRENISGVAI